MAITMHGTQNPSSQGQQTQVQFQHQPAPQQQQFQQAPVQQPMQQPFQQPAPVQQQYGQPVQQPVQQPYGQPVDQQAQPVYGQPPIQAPVQTPVPVQQAPAVGTSDDAVKQISKFVSSAGLTPSQVEHEFTTFGGLTESTRQALVRKHGEGTTNLLVQSMQGIAQQTQAQQTQQNAAIYTQVETAFQGTATPGQTGQQSWNELAAWVKQNVDVNQRAAYNSMLTSKDPVQAQLAVDSMINTYKAANGVGQTADLITGDQGGTTTATGVEQMTVAEYSKQLDKLVEEHGYNSPQVAQLNATRDAARQRGIN